MALLEVTNLKTHFMTRDGVVKAVDGVSFTVEDSQTLAIVGESGSGKSVTALSLMRLIPDPPGKIIDGRIILKGDDVLKMDDSTVRSMRGDRIAMIFQDPMTSLNPVFRVGFQIGEALRIHKGMTRKEAAARAVEMLDLVGIPNPAQRARDYPHQFSGGMRQRAMIAMALACDPDILIADEPTTALDVTIQAQILELMIELQQRKGTAIIMITHDLGVVADMADNVMVMYAGKQIEYGTADDVFYRPRHPYTWGLLNSLPRHDIDEKGTLLPIEGQPPSLIDVPSGCAFNPRCPYAQDRCRTESPVLREITPSHHAACHFAGEDGFVRGKAVPVTGEVA
ncbi:MAG: ABC transporter ATP-binding protein [Coriobacteriia bacterium]|nr:ABC transporter ATP-binding protein [Coriobacteriia bacterium]